MADRTDGMKGRALIKQLSGMPHGVNPLNVPHQLKQTVCLAKGIVDTWDNFPSDNNFAIALERAAAISRLAISLLQERKLFTGSWHLLEWSQRKLSNPSKPSRWKRF